MTEEDAKRLKPGDIIIYPVGERRMIVEWVYFSEHYDCVLIYIVSTRSSWVHPKDVQPLPSLRLRWETEDNDRRRCQASKAR
jgi:hypothetical protein